MSSNSEQNRPFVSTSRAIARLPGLAALLGSPISLAPHSLAKGVVAWGRKPSARRAERFAAKRGLPLYRLEDGFLRSIGMGKGDPPLSIVVDDRGIYYDATSPSLLETLIASPLSPAQRARASQLVSAWREGRVSKYNHALEAQFESTGPYVLAIDQTFGDASIRYGLAEAKSFHRMLDAALSENPNCEVVLKVHPEVMAGRKRGHFDLRLLAKNPRVRVLGEDMHPVTLLEHARAVYTVTSQVGFEGLVWGKPVRTFGMPFYAGWGLTRDELPAPARREPLPLENLVHAALIEYPRYIDPETGRRCEVERLIEWISLQRRMRGRFPPHVYAANFSPWKQPMIRSFFQGSAVTFIKKASELPEGATLGVWGRRQIRGAVPSGTSFVRLEDGFLRSVGLGADLVRPLSWVMDREGIYYDATQSSELESLLQSHRFEQPLLSRARALRDAIVRHGLTKYNVGAGEWIRPERRAGAAGALKKVVLVPGQVEKDASIHFGAAEIRTNLGLLQAVRKGNPDTYVVYKPHPDVLAGLRASGSGEAEAARWCDEIVEDVPMQTMLDAVDEVHVLTSLAGFEALLRDKPVVTYGRPFYAGWGVTTDHASFERRSRRLTLDELVAGVLILYPTYVSRATGRFTTPERALEELLAWRSEGIDGSLWRKALRAVLRILKLNG